MQTNNQRWLNRPEQASPHPTPPPPSRGVAALRRPGTDVRDIVVSKDLRVLQPFLVLAQGAELLQNAVYFNLFAIHKNGCTYITQGADGRNQQDTRKNKRVGVGQARVIHARRGQASSVVVGCYPSKAHMQYSYRPADKKPTLKNVRLRFKIKAEQKKLTSLE